MGKREIGQLSLFDLIILLSIADIMIIGIENYELNCEPIDDGGIIQERFRVPVSKINEYLKNLDTKEVSIAAATICGIFYALNRIK